MTTPAHSESVLIDGVPIGPTEIVTFLGLLASLLTMIFHTSFGLDANIQQVSASALIVLPIALGVLRSFKHAVKARSAVAVAVAQITTVAFPTPTDLPPIPGYVPAPALVAAAAPAVPVDPSPNATGLPSSSFAPADPTVVTG